MVAATRDGGLPHLVNALRAGLGAEVGLIDLSGSVIATAPSRAIWDAEAVRRATIEPGLMDGPLLARPIIVNGETVAILAARVATDTANLLSTAIDLIVIELGRLRAAQHGRRELAGGLVEDILSGRLSEADSIGRMRSIGLDATNPVRVLLGAVDPASGAPAHIPLGGIFSLMNDRAEPFLRLTIGEHIFVVVPDDPMVERIAQNLCSQLEETARSARVGVSLAHSGGAGLRAAYYEALSALRQGPGVQYPGQLDIGRLLVLGNITVPIVQIARDLLRPLRDYDAVHGSTLVDTLRAHLEADRDIARTTTALFVHRNTLRYRLRQIATLLDIDLDSTSAISSLRLAFLAVDHEQGNAL